MGFQAPTAYEKFTAVQSALLSYNRPLLLACVFVASFLLVFLLSKRNVLMSLSASLGAVFILAAYYIVMFVSVIRY